jgi:hypothetical protein
MMILLFQDRPAVTERFPLASKTASAIRISDLPE